MSNFERVAVVTTVLALLLAAGSAIGFGFFVNDSSQWPTSGPNQLSKHHVRSGDEIGSVQPLPVSAADRSKENVGSVRRSTVPNTAIALSNIQQDVSESSTPAGGANAMKKASPSDSPPAVLPNVRQRASAPSNEADRARSNDRPIASRTSELCRTDACRKALAECTQVCDTAMTMGVAACPRVSSGASAKDEKECLAKRDRRQRDCHSGCALRQSRALQVE
jgi:hypothetical protein